MGVVLVIMLGQQAQARTLLGKSDVQAPWEAQIEILI